MTGRYSSLLGEVGLLHSAGAGPDSAFRALDSEYHARLEQSVGRSLAALLETASGLIDTAARQLCFTMIIAGCVGATIAIDYAPSLQEAWTARPSQAMVKTVQIFSLLALSAWLFMSDNGRSDAEKPLARETWAAKLLLIFEDHFPAAMQRFLARDLQLQSELSNPRNAGGDERLLGSILLWSDACQALGALPLAERLTNDGFPYERAGDLLSASGAQILNQPDPIDLAVLGAVRGVVSRLAVAPSEHDGS